MDTLAGWCRTLKEERYVLDTVPPPNLIPVAPPTDDFYASLHKCGVANLSQPKNSSLRSLSPSKNWREHTRWLVMGFERDVVYLR